MDDFKMTAYIKGFGLIGIIVGATVFTLLCGLNWIVLIGAVFFALPMVKYLWQYARNVRNNPCRFLPKVLPKAQFSIELSEWEDQGQTRIFKGTYQGVSFVIRAMNHASHITIYDQPWYGVSASDPEIVKFFEAMNDINSDVTSVKVLMGEPNKHGIRAVYTYCCIMLPDYFTYYYIEYVLCHMLNRRAAFLEALKKERPYMKQRRGTVGFNLQPDSSASAEEEVSPAAKTDSEVGDDK